MLDWLDAIPNLGVPGVPGVQPQISAGYTGTPEKNAGVPGVPGPRNAADYPAILREWHGHLSAIDDCRAPPTFSVMWWQQACDDARWIYENFASRAVRDGWSAHDLFGVLPWHPGWGGLCDRLHGARNLKMDGPMAVWSRFGMKESTCAEAGDQLVTSGLVLIWEIIR